MKTNSTNCDSTNWSEIWRKSSFFAWKMNFATEEHELLGDGPGTDRIKKEKKMFVRCKNMP